MDVKRTTKVERTQLGKFIIKACPQAGYKSFNALASVTEWNAATVWKIVSGEKPLKGYALLWTLANLLAVGIHRQRQLDAMTQALAQEEGISVDKAKERLSAGAEEMQTMPMPDEAKFDAQEAMGKRLNELAMFDFLDRRENEMIATTEGWYWITSDETSRRY